MNIKKIDYLELPHDKILERLSAETYFVNYMNIKGMLAAVYRCRKPDTKLGHKEYVLVYNNGYSWFISGLTRYQIKKYSKMNGVLCKNCDTFLYSMTRHDFHNCACPNETSVDGGKDYIHCGGKDLSKLVHGSIDLLTDKVKLDTNTPKA